MIKQQKLAQQPCENIEKKRNMLFHKDYLHICVHGNKWTYIHWGLSPQKMKLVSLYFNQPFPKFQIQLRIYRVTGVQFDGYNALGFQKLIVRDSEGSLKIEGLEPGFSYCLELGIILKRNKFLPLLRSNTKKIPGARMGIDAFSEMELDREDSMPKWSQSVSTYTLYDNVNNGWLKE